MNQVIARRIGRITFGAALLAGVAYLLTAAWAWTRASPHLYDGHGFHAARIITLTWLFAAAAGFVASRIAARFSLTRGPDWLFAESLMAPTLGIALLLPLTLHMPVVILLSDSLWFDTWVFGSLWITSLTHVVFAGSCTLRAYQLVASKPARSPRTIYVATLITSCVPFILLYAIPPVIVAITALPLIPLMRAMETLVARERNEIAGAPHPLPQAIVRLPPDA